MQWIYRLRKPHTRRTNKFILNAKSIFDPSLKRKFSIDIEDLVEETDHSIEKEGEIVDSLTSIEKSLIAFHNLPKSGPFAQASSKEEKQV